jgi:serine/threonine-protein kinase
VPNTLVGATLGKYRIEERIRAGGMATVYRAYQADLDRLVAVKVLIPSADDADQARERFRAEARAVAQLDHRNILQVYDYGEQDGVFYLVMPLVNGALSDHIGLPRPLAWSIDICSQVADALQYAHDRGILHCDVNPSNILLGPGDRAMLADFGIARMVGQASPHGQPMLGTAGYVSPEQRIGQSADARSDQYALAVTFFELVAGRLPYRAETNTAATVRRHREAPIPSLRTHVPELPPAVDEVVRRALAGRPADRFDTVAAFAAALRRAADSYIAAPATAAVDPPPAPRRGLLGRAPSRRRIGMALGALAVAVVLIGAGFLARESQTQLPAAEPPSSPPTAADVFPGQPSPQSVLIVHAACLAPAATMADADAALAAGALVAAEQSYLALADCPGVERSLVESRLTETDELLAARADQAAGDREPAIARLRALGAVDPTLPGLSNVLFAALLRAGRAALDADVLPDAKRYCGEAVAMRPTDPDAVRCLASATQQTAEPSPTPSEAPAPVAVPPVVSSPTAALTPTPVLPPTLTPRAPTATPPPEPTPALLACPEPSALFTAPSVALGETTTLFVAGLAPEAPFTLAVVDAPDGYSAPPLQLRTDASCQRSIAMVFREDEHPAGLWTFEVQGAGAAGSAVRLSANLFVVP